MFFWCWFSKNDVDVDVALVIDLDGNVYILDNSSRKLLSSWSSGFPIYSSYQNLTENWSVSSKSNASQPSTEFFIDVGDDWQLYKHTPNKIEVRATPTHFLVAFHQLKMSLFIWVLLFFLFNIMVSLWDS